MNESRLVYSCSFFMLAFVLIAVSKPKVAFDDNGHIRPFGTGNDTNNNTLMPLGVITAVLAIVCFYMFSVMDMILS